MCAACTESGITAGTEPIGVLTALGGMTPGVDGGKAPGIDSSAGVSAIGLGCCPFCAKAGLGSSILFGGNVSARFGIKSSGTGAGCAVSSGTFMGIV